MTVFSPSLKRFYRNKDTEQYNNNQLWGSECSQIPIHASWNVIQ